MALIAKIIITMKPLIKKKTILIIDDEKVVRESFQFFLEDIQFDVLSASDGIKGLKIIESNHPDLVLLDLRMPKLSGLEVLKQLQEYLKEHPIIIISGNGIITDVIESLKLGAWDYILKPINDMSILKYAVKNALDKSRLIKENNKYQKNLESLVKLKTKRLTEVNLELAKHQNNLEILVKEKNKKLIKAQQNLIENAYKSGMSEIATDTLHNIGNLLNNVKTSCHVTSDVINKLPIRYLKRINIMLKDNLKYLQTVFIKQPQLKDLTQYYFKIEEALDRDKNTLTYHIQRLEKKINAIAEVIIAQQSYAGISSLSEPLNICTIIDDALIMQQEPLKRHKIILKKDYQLVPLVRVHRTKLVHILINLLKNAKDSLAESSIKIKKIFISVYNNKKNIIIDIKDNGIGIEQNNLITIFNHGFTTKKHGHGFGLHSCANYMTEMNGNINATSEGHGKGAQFTLSIPL